MTCIFLFEISKNLIVHMLKCQHRFAGLDIFIISSSQDHDS